MTSLLFWLLKSRLFLVIFGVVLLLLIPVGLKLVTNRINYSRKYPNHKWLTDIRTYSGFKAKTKLYLSVLQVDEGLVFYYKALDFLIRKDELHQVRIMPRHEFIEQMEQQEEHDELKYASWVMMAEDERDPYVVIIETLHYPPFVLSSGEDDVKLFHDYFTEQGAQ